MGLKRIAGAGMLLGILLGISMGVCHLARKAFVWREPSVDLRGETGTVRPLSAPAAGEAPLRFAVAPLEDPKTTFVTYQRLVRRICQKVGRKDQFVMFSSYSEVRKAIERSEIEVGFVCTGVYVHGQPGGRIRLLVQPEYEDGGEFRCLILVPADSEARNIRDLRGKMMAFTDRESYAGCLVPAALLLEEGLGLKDFFGRVSFTNGHDRSIRAVSLGAVDAAAVNSLIWEANRKRTPSLDKQVKVLWSSEAFGPPPVVVPSGLDESLRAALRQAFLSLDQEPEDRQMLAALGLRRFVSSNEESYRTAQQLYRKVCSLGGGQWP